MKLQLLLVYMLAMSQVACVCPLASSYWTLKNDHRVYYDVNACPTPIRVSFIKGPSAKDPNKCQHKFTTYSQDGCFSQTAEYTGYYNTGDKYWDPAKDDGWLPLTLGNKDNIIWLNNVKCNARRPEYEKNFLFIDNYFVSYRFVSKTELHLATFTTCINCPGSVLRMAMTRDYFSPMKVVWKDAETSPNPPKPVINDVSPPPIKD